MFEKQKSPTSIFSHNLFSGLFMIGLGLAYFLVTQGFLDWVTIGIFFAFIPALAVIYSGWCEYQTTGRLSGGSITRLMWGLFPFTFMALWYSGIDIGQVWPIVLVFIGITMLFNQNRN